MGTPNSQAHPSSFGAARAPPSFLVRNPRKTLGFLCQLYITMRLYHTASALLLEHERQTYILLETNLDPLLARDDLHAHLLSATANLPSVAALPSKTPLLPPIDTQEVWLPA
jgi:hypothetical protein